MTKIEKAVTWALAIANDNTHGYDQQYRWGPDYDCSSLIISAWQQAGVPVKTKGAAYTGKYEICVSCLWIHRCHFQSESPNRKRYETR